MKSIHLIIISVAIIFVSCKQDNPKATNTDGKSNITQDIPLEKKNAPLYFERADYYYKSQEYDKAITDLETAISLDSLQPQYYHLLSDCYMDYYRSKDALLQMKQVVELFPDRIPSLLKLSETQLILKQYDESLLTVAKILTRAPDNADGHFMKGMNFRAMGETDRAINAFQTATELNPDMVDAWLLAGDLLDKKGLPIALDYYTAAVNIAPDEPTALHSKAYYLQNHGKENEALELYQQINKLDRNYLDAYLNTGILYMTMDSLEKAKEQFNIMAGIAPTDHRPYYYRGLILREMGDKVNAIADFQNCINLNPDFSKAKSALNEMK